MPRPVALSCIIARQFRGCSARSAWLIVQGRIFAVTKFDPSTLRLCRARRREATPNERGTQSLLVIYMCYVCATIIEGSYSRTNMECHLNMQKLKLGTPLTSFQPKRSFFQSESLQLHFPCLVMLVGRLEGDMPFN